jgi:hypothetical protein
VPALCAAVAAAAAGPTAAAAAADAAVALCKLQPDDWQQQLQQLQANLLSEDRLATLPARYVAGASFFTLCGIAEMWSACLHQLVGGGGLYLNLPAVISMCHNWQGAGAIAHRCGGVIGHVLL